MRFDDSLKTVLGADDASGFGAQSAFRQIVDLVGRGRVPPDPAILDRLLDLRGRVPLPVRAASARALAVATPPAALVALMAQDDPAVASPVLRAARLGADEWAALIPALGPHGRAVLRDRRDLPEGAVRALEAFGPTDFSLGYDPAPGRAGGDEGPAPLTTPQPAAPIAEPGSARGSGVTEAFVALGAIARELPIVAEAMRRAEPAPQGEGPAFAEPFGAPFAPGNGFGAEHYEIAELVSRIERFQRGRERQLPAVQPARRSGFSFETDPYGTIRWCEGAERGAILGLRVDGGGAVAVDGGVAGAFRARSRFGDGRMTVPEGSAIAGEWRISGVPMFDPASGRFLGMRGQARRPRRDETGAGAPAGESAGKPAREPDRAGAEALRRLVHELRTPTNAISGFAELIESELLGPAAPVYRERARTIRRIAADLVAAVDDLDTAARIESGALSLRPATVRVAALLDTAGETVAELAAERGATVTRDITGDPAVAADATAAERLVCRLLALAVAEAEAGETIAVEAREGAGGATIAISRPRALMGVPGERLFDTAIDDGEGAQRIGAPLLGTGFALRLADNLARELGGSLTIGQTALTLALPSATDRGAQAQIH